jgi:hypothetical protein
LRITTLPLLASRNEYRPELELKLQVGQLCNECRAKLRAAGLDPDELRPLVDVVRNLAHGVGV